MMDRYDTHNVIGPQYGRCCDCQRWLDADNKNRCKTCTERWGDALDALKKAFEAHRKDG